MIGARAENRVNQRFLGEFLPNLRSGAQAFGKCDRKIRAAEPVLIRIEAGDSLKLRRRPGKKENCRAVLDRLCGFTFW